MKIAIFDLDFTLIPMDSGYNWVRYVAMRSGGDEKAQLAELDRFAKEYLLGTLDIAAYEDFHMQVLARHSRSDLDAWRKDFLRCWVKPNLPAASFALLHQLRESSVMPVMATATYSYVTRPIADLFGIKELIAAHAQEDTKGEFTGRLAGDPTLGPWKLKAVKKYLDSCDEPIEALSVYSDSHNDMPLFEYIASRGGECIAANSDPELAAYASRHHWRTCSTFTAEQIKAACEPRNIQ